MCIYVHMYQYLFIFNLNLRTSNECGDDINNVKIMFELNLIIVSLFGTKYSLVLKLRNVFVLDTITFDKRNWTLQQAKYDTNQIVKSELYLEYVLSKC